MPITLYVTVALRSIRTSLRATLHGKNRIQLHFLGLIEVEKPMPPTQRLPRQIRRELVDAITEGNTSNAIPARKSLLEQIAIAQMDLRAELKNSAAAMRDVITHTIDMRTLAPEDESGGPSGVLFRIEHPAEEIRIGIGKSATPSQLEKMVQECRKVVEDDLVFLARMTKLVEDNQTLNVDDASRLNRILVYGSFNHLFIPSY